MRIPTRSLRRGLLALGLASLCADAIRSPVLAAAAAAPESSAEPASGVQAEALRRRWLADWEGSILDGSRDRYCDREMGEEIGWLISPFLSGFYHGYLATRDPKWVDRFVDWAEAWIGRSSGGD